METEKDNCLFSLLVIMANHTNCYLHAPSHQHPSQKSVINALVQWGISIPQHDNLQAELNHVPKRSSE